MKELYEIGQVIKKLESFNKSTESSIELTKSEIDCILSNYKKQQIIIQSMSEYLDEVLEILFYWLALPEENYVFNFILEDWKINFKYISKRLQESWILEDKLLKDLINFIWIENITNLFKDWNELDFDHWNMKHTQYNVLLDWSDYNVSISLNREGWENLYGIYLTPMYVFKSSLIEKFEWFLAVAAVKDSETKKHLDRVELYSNLLASELLKRWLFSDILDEEFIENVSLTAPLHDLWKIFVHEKILKKPWKLNLEEFMEMKTHTTNWSKMIDAWFSKYKWTKLKKLINIASNIAENHHENYDWSGYPNWLIWEDIPLEARIVSIVDVFDALMSKRSYKKEWSKEDTRKKIESLSWSKFDPVITKVFFDIFDQIISIREKNND